MSRLPFSALLIVGLTVTSLLIPLGVHARDPTATHQQAPVLDEWTFDRLTLAADFAPVEWLEAKVPKRRPRHHGHDLYQLVRRLPIDLQVDGEPRSFQRSPEHVLVLDDGDLELSYHALAGAWSLHSRKAESKLTQASLSRQEAAEAVAKALAKIVDMDDRVLTGVAGNTLSEEREDGAGESRVLSYNVFFQHRIDGTQLVGGGAVSSGTVTGSADKPQILSLGHAPADFDLAASPTLYQVDGHLLAEAKARQKLLKGDVLLADTPPDAISHGEVTRVARAYFVDGRFLHAEAIPVYVYQVLFQPLAGEAFTHNYFVAALSHDGWQTLGYDAKDLDQDSRTRPATAGIDAEPGAAVWQDDEAFPFTSPAVRQGVMAFASAHCLPRWNAERSEWSASAVCRNSCADRGDVCAAMPGGSDRVYSMTVRWAGLTASHIPDVDGALPLDAEYRQAWADRLRAGFDNACWTPSAGFGDQGYVTDAGFPNHPNRADIVSAGQQSEFFFHMSHGWGFEEVACPGVTRIFSNIAPHGGSIVPWAPLLPPIGGFFSSCGIEPDWAGQRLRYFFTMTSFANAGRHQWTQVVGGGPDHPKVVIGNVSHGNRFHFSPYAPDPASSQPADPSAYPNMIANFFHNLALVDTSEPLSCSPAGMSFRVAMREAVKGTATSQTDYFWNPTAHRNHPKMMRLVFSTEDQALDEHLTGWGAQYPNDGNHSGWAYEAWGDEWSP